MMGIKTKVIIQCSRHFSHFVFIVFLKFCMQVQICLESDLYLISPWRLLYNKISDLSIKLMQNMKYKNTTSTELTKMFQKIKFNTIVSHITTTSLCLTCVAFITTTYFFQTQLFSLMLLLFQTYLCLKPLTSQQPTRWG